jgi:hypothetical protein
MMQQGQFHSFSRHGTFALAFLPILIAFSVETPALASSIAINLATAKITSEFADYVGKNSVTSEAIVKQGQTIEEVVLAKCGPVNDAYYVAVQAANPGVTINFRDRKNANQSNTVVNLPSCIPAPQFQVGSVASDSVASLQDLFEKDSAGFKSIGSAPVTWASRTEYSSGRPLEADLNANTRGDIGPSNPPPVQIQADLRSPEATVKTFSTTGFKDYQSAFVALNAEIARPSDSNDLLYPKTAPNWMSLELKPTADKGSAVEKVKSTAELGSDDVDPESFQLFANESSESCDLAGQSSNSFDRNQLNTLITVLVRNKAILSQVGAGIETTGMYVIDGGVYANDVWPFRKKGSSFSVAGRPKPASFEPFVEMDEVRFPGVRSHGTEVATVAVGGRALSDMLYTLGYLPQLSSINVYVAGTEETLRDRDGQAIRGQDGLPQKIKRYSIDQTLFYNVLSQMQGIVNISMGRRNAIPAFDPVLSRSSKTLYVVAAGNRPGPGKDLLTYPIYPAYYGGAGHGGRYNLLTVVALGRKGERLRNSNFSSKYADIGALGECVDTLRFDPVKGTYFPILASGTSFSAPQVALTLALIKSTLGADSSAADARTRLLAGSDIRPHLTEDIEDGRVLNPVKALASIFFDVVEAKSAGEAETKVIHGRVLAPITFSNLCLNASEIPDTGRLVKIIPRFDGTKTSSKSAMAYWLDEGDEFHKSTCDLKTQSLTIEEDGTLKTYTFDIGEITDIIPALNMKWRNL